MKTILIGSTALLAAAIIAPAAQASEPVKLQLGGFMEYYVTGASQDDDFKGSVNSFDVQGEGEIYFQGKTTLDNGMTIGVMVQLESGTDNNGSDTIDESYLYVEGKYGKAILGSTDNVAYLMRATAPNAAYTEVDDTAIPNYLARPDDVTDNITDLGFDGDANKAIYMTPKFYGLQAGVSYTASNNGGGDDEWANGSNNPVTPLTNSESVVKAVDFDEAWAFGLSYEREIGPVGMLATAGYTIANGNGANAKDAEDWAFGLNLTYAGFTLGGAYRVIDAPEGSFAEETDGYAWDAGLMYAEGPYAVSINYRKSGARGDTATAGKDTIDTYALGGKYTLGAGVDVFGQLAYAQYDAEGDEQDNAGAFGGVVGLHLDF
ncbi:Outer membrane protein (Porin) [uncultured Alphaproteobacteria bacterium]|uniref:Outer membrane protein (Porin) n=1 Tax=uncultured Alphaproteobacteria bacterium TaxID=91750 RepID=A0A212KBQ9_9PROT|nr:Outer membrane protein (Porin) [uncultured Alphaproteobacteria bacterium]